MANNVASKQNLPDECETMNQLKDRLDELVNETIAGMTAAGTSGHLVVAVAECASGSGMSMDYDGLQLGVIVAIIQCLSGVLVKACGGEETSTTGTGHLVPGQGVKEIN